MNYIATKLRQELFVSSIISIHYFEYTRDFYYQGESHDFWEIIFCDKGELEIVAGEKELLLKRGEAFIHPPCQFHNVKAHGDKSANSIILSFYSDTAELSGISDKVISTDSYVAGALFSILREAKLNFKDDLGKLHVNQLLRKEQPSHFASEQIIQNYIELLLIHLIRKEQNAVSFPEIPAHSERNGLLEGILAYMQSNIDNKITFSDITKEFSVSPTTLKKLFDKTYNHGAMEHLTRMRIEYSKDLLRDGHYSCTEIATLCGFCSVHHFSGVFRKYEAMSPTEYVKSVKAMLEINS